MVMKFGSGRSKSKGEAECFAYPPSSGRVSTQTSRPSPARAKTSTIRPAAEKAAAVIGDSQDPYGAVVFSECPEAWGCIAIGEYSRAERMREESGRAVEEQGSASQSVCSLVNCMISGVQYSDLSSNEIKNSIPSVQHSTIGYF
jgi:hypothetical protein